MSSQTPPQSQKQGFLQRSISKPAAAAVLLAAVILAVIIILAIPRLYAPEPSQQLEIISKSDWWSKEEIPDAIGGDSVFHVKVAIKNYGEAAGVCVLHVKAEETNGRFWTRFRFVSVSPGDTVEEQVDFPEVVDQNVVYSAWLTPP